MTSDPVLLLQYDNPCSELGIVMVGHTPLSADMITGRIKCIDDMAPNDYHRYFPHFQPENFVKNLELVVELEEADSPKQRTTAQLSLSSGSSSEPECWNAIHHPRY